MCNQASHDHLRSSQVAQAVAHSSSHPLQHLRPKGDEHSTLVTFLIKRACVTPKTYGSKTCCSWKFPEPLHVLKTGCITAWRHFKTSSLGLGSSEQVQEAISETLRREQEKKITFHTKAHAVMGGRHEEVSLYLKERTEMTGASWSWLFMEASWNSEMHQVVMAFLQWRLPNMYLTTPHKKIHDVPADSTPSNQSVLQTHWKPSNFLILSQTHLIFKN